MRISKENKKNTDTIASRIEKLMDEKGMSRSDLARALCEGDESQLQGMKNSVTRWLNGTRNISLYNISRICDVLGTDESYLIGRNDSNYRRDIIRAGEDVDQALLFRRVIESYAAYVCGCSIRSLMDPEKGTQPLDEALQEVDDFIRKRISPLIREIDEVDDWAGVEDPGEVYNAQEILEKLPAMTGDFENDLRTAMGLDPVPEMCRSCEKARVYEKCKKLFA